MAVAPAESERYTTTRKVTLVGAAVNLLLATGQIVVGLIGQAQSLIADGAHTLSDLVGDFLVLLAAREASRAADESHPYGHGRIETVATVILGLALISVAVAFAVDAAQRLLDPERLLQPRPITLIAALAAVILKESLYHYTRLMARRIGSRLLEANAWHHRSDAISSVIVVAGIGGTLSGVASLDAVATIGVALFIGQMGLRFVYHSFRELIDSALEPEKVDVIRRVITGVDGVQSLHMLRTRAMGGRALVDVHIQVSPFISVSEGHQIAETVLNRLKREVGEVSDVTVHIDPEDDETAEPNRHRPLRGELLGRLRPLLEELPRSQDLEHVRLHYLGGKIHIELVLPITDFDTPKQARDAASQFARSAKQLDEVGSAQVFFR
jgi:cation diffusion facilitator family transporter